LGKGARRVFGLKIDMAAYDGPRPWETRSPVLPNGFDELLKGYDALLATYGPAADLHLPDSPNPFDNIRLAGMNPRRRLKDYHAWRNLSVIGRRTVHSRAQIDRIEEALDRMVEIHGRRKDIHIPEPDVSMGIEGTDRLFMIMHLREMGSTLADYAEWRAGEEAMERGEWARRRSPWGGNDHWMRYRDDNGERCLSYSDSPPAKEFDADEWFAAEDAAKAKAKNAHEDRVMRADRLAALRQTRAALMGPRVSPASGNSPKP
jgi:hypothetical protein